MFEVYIPHPVLGTIAIGSVCRKSADWLLLFVNHFRLIVVAAANSVEVSIDQKAQYAFLSEIKISAQPCGM